MLAPTQRTALHTHRNRLIRVASWIAGVLLPLALCISAAWLADDAYITLRWVQNYWSGHGFYWNPGERVMVSSHPLWLAVLLICGGLPWRIEWSTFGVSLILTAYTLVRLHRKGPAIGLILAFSPIFVDFSCSGLENPLAHLLLALLAQQRANNTTTRALLSALVVLTRPDLVPLVAPTFLVLLVKHPRNTLLSLIPVLLYLIAAFAWFGTITPNPALAKLGAGLGPMELIPKGLRWLLSAAEFDPVGSLIILAGILSTLQDSHLVRLGTLLQVCWIIWVGGDFMEGRFLSPLLVFNVASLTWQPWRRQSAAFLVPLLAIGLWSPRSPIRQGVEFENKELDEFAIADERGFWYQTTGLWPRLQSGRPLPPVQQNSGPGGVLELGAVGLDAFMAGAQVHVIDRFALTDPFLARLPCDCAGAFRTGHLERPIPAGYMESLESGTNQLADPQHRVLLDEVWLLSRAPLWSRDRWLHMLHIDRTSTVVEPSQTPLPK
jgi:arabinofuranosyltransferase